MNLARTRIAEPDIAVFNEVDSNPIFESLSGEQKFKLATLIQALRDERLDWKFDSLCLRQSDMKRVAKMRREAHRKMRQWTAVRDIGVFLAGIQQEHGKLKLVGEIYNGTVKVVHQ